ncbi:MAG: IS110 family transposase [Sporolactobacillus sp.]
MTDRQLVDHFKITNDAIGFQRLVSTIQKFAQMPAIIFEATGVYSRRLKALLDDHGYRYTQLNPLLAKMQLDRLHPNKTDPNDARRLAETEFQLNRPQTDVQAPVYTQLKDLNRFYQQLTGDNVQAKNRLHRVLQLTFPELERLNLSHTEPLYYHLMKLFPQPQMVRNHSLDEVTEQILQSTLKHIGSLRAQRLAKQLIQSAARSYPAVPIDSPVVEQTVYWADQILTLSTQRKAVIEELKQRAETLPEYAIYLSIPGFAVTTAVAVIAELGDLRRFDSPNQINAYIGIDLRHYESGQFTAADAISKRGDAFARKILYRSIGTIASAAHYHPNHINDYYQRKKQSPGAKTKKIAIAAVHRLIRTLYFLVTHNQKYDYGLATRS